LSNGERRSLVVARRRLQSDMDTDRLDRRVTGERLDVLVGFIIAAAV